MNALMPFIHIFVDYFKANFTQKAYAYEVVRREAQQPRRKR
jgi:hypothetical protein